MFSCYDHLFIVFTRPDSIKVQTSPKADSNYNGIKDTGFKSRKSILW